MPKVNRTAEKLRQLKALLAGKSSLLIVLQDHPDPDALAAAGALRKLAHALGGLSCSITCGGSVGRAENRALVRYMGLNLRPLGSLDLKQFDVVAMVDTQPGQGNNSLPPGTPVHVVVDHHPLQDRTRTAAVFDVRRRYGATSTILYEYLRAAGAEIDAVLATALLYGIRSDTQDLGRESIQADSDAYRDLYPLANKRALGTIQHGDEPTEYYRMLAAALQNARLCGKCIYCDLGAVTNPDMIAEVADLLLRHEEPTWSLCWGDYEGQLLLSLRSDVSDPPADAVMRKIVHRKGAGGGHRAMAGGQIPLEAVTPAQRKRLCDLIRKRFLHVTGNEKAEGRKLL